MGQLLIGVVLGIARRTAHNEVARGNENVVEAVFQVGSHLRVSGHGLGRWLAVAGCEVPGEAGHASKRRCADYGEERVPASHRSGCRRYRRGRCGWADYCFRSGGSVPGQNRRDGTGEFVEFGVRKSAAPFNQVGSLNSAESKGNNDVIEERRNENPSPLRMVRLDQHPVGLNRNPRPQHNDASRVG
jgi:hypothetical protein